jgi:hypothetical protein
MVNKDTSERPLNQKAAAAWDARQRRIANQEADAHSRNAAIKEIAKASRESGREIRGGMTESGIVNPKRISGGLVTGIIDVGNRRRHNSSW